MKITPELSLALRTHFPIKHAYNVQGHQQARDLAIKEVLDANPEAQKLIDTYRDHYKQMSVLARDLSTRFGLRVAGEQVHISSDAEFAKAGGLVAYPSYPLNLSQSVELLSAVDESAGIQLLKTWGINWE